MKDLFKLLTEDFSIEEAVEYFKSKVPMKASEFYKIAEEYRSLAFTVSGYTKAQVLKKFQDELLKSIENGTTMDEFKGEMNEFLENKGYKGLTAFQADNIFRTNIQTAYQVGHYKQMTSEEVMKYRPYWQYDAVNDRRTRPSHLAMDGKVYRADDPIWDTWYPPNGFRCRCSVNTLSERQVVERGLSIEDKPPRGGEVNGVFINISPDPKFATNPAKAVFNPDMTGYPEALKKAFSKREDSASKGF